MDEAILQELKVLADTIQIAIQRMEQAFKIFSDRAEDLARTSVELTTAKDNLEITDEALKRALSEVDAQVDDLAKIAAAMTVLQQQLEARANS